jgi:hypothetical protein
MNNTVRDIAISFFALCASVSMLFSLISPFYFPKKKTAQNKNEGIKYRAIGMSLAACFAFVAVELLVPNIICIPVLLIFIGLFWLEFLLNPFRQS